jgi:hypothetical protein
LAGKTVAVRTRALPSGSYEMIFRATMQTRFRSKRACIDAALKLAARKLPFNGNSRQPRFLPKEQASGLTPAMRFSVASDLLQVYGIAHPPRSSFCDRIASFVRSLEDFKLPAAVFQHFRHEWKLVQPAVFIKRAKDFFFAPHFNDFPGAKIECEVGLGVRAVHFFPPERSFWIYRPDILNVRRCQ